jgi:hypothetical protein
MPMKLVLATTLLFCLSLLAMAVGVLFGRPGIAGSCGGLAGLCDHGGRPLCEDCPNRREDPQQRDYETG